MKLTKLITSIGTIGAMLSSISCQNSNEDYGWLKNGIDTSVSQLLLTADEISDTGMMPRSIWVGYDLDFLAWQLDRDPATFKDSLRAHPETSLLGLRRLCDEYNWTSGFYPGSLWLAYELTGNEDSF